MRYRRPLLMFASVSLAMLLSYQPKILPMISVVPIREFAVNFNATHDGQPPIRDAWRCKGVEDMDLSFAESFSLAFRKIDDDYRTYVLLVALKLHYCHIESTDGVSSTIVETAYGKFHPYYIAFRRSFSEMPGEFFPASISLDWLEQNPEFLNSQFLREEAQRICESYKSRGYDNFTTFCKDVS